MLHTHPDNGRVWYDGGHVLIGRRGFGWSDESTA